MRALLQWNKPLTAITHGQHARVMPLSRSTARGGYSFQPAKRIPDYREVQIFRARGAESNITCMHRCIISFLLASLASSIVFFSFPVTRRRGVATSTKPRGKFSSENFSIHDFAVFVSLCYASLDGYDTRHDNEMRR